MLQIEKIYYSVIYTIKNTDNFYSVLHFGNNSHKEMDDE